MSEDGWRIGRLGAASGLSVRTLHHWDALGLVSPSARTDGGHRVYGPGDLERLYQVLALRSLGLPLSSIRTCLDGGVDVEQIVADQLTDVERRLADLTALRDRLVRVERAVQGRAQDTPEVLLEAIRAQHPVDDDVVRRFVDADQLELLASSARSAGPAARYLLEVEWPQLYREAQALLANGTPPDDGAVRRIAARLDELGRRFSGGDPAVSRRVRAAWREAPDELSGCPDPPAEDWVAVVDFLDRARALATGSTHPEEER